MSTDTEYWLQVQYPELVSLWQKAYLAQKTAAVKIGGECTICHIRSNTGMHYGVYSCEADKQFLKRTFHDKQEYQICNLQCPPRFRGWCQYCRLKSSLSAGINLKMIRTYQNLKRTRSKSSNETTPSTPAAPSAKKTRISKGGSKNQPKADDNAAVTSQQTPCDENQTSAKDSTEAVVKVEPDIIECSTEDSNTYQRNGAALSTEMPNFMPNHQLNANSMQIKGWEEANGKSYTAEDLQYLRMYEQYHHNQQVYARNLACQYAQFTAEQNRFSAGWPRMADASPLTPNNPTSPFMAYQHLPYPLPRSPPDLMNATKLDQMFPQPAHGSSVAGFQFGAGVNNDTGSRQNVCPPQMTPPPGLNGFSLPPSNRVVHQESLAHKLKFHQETDEIERLHIDLSPKNDQKACRDLKHNQDPKAGKFLTVIPEGTAAATDPKDLSMDALHPCHYLPSPPYTNSERCERSPVQSEPLDLSSSSSSASSSASVASSRPSSRCSLQLSRPPSAGVFGSPRGQGTCLNKLSVNSTVLQEALASLEGGLSQPTLTNLSHVSDVLSDTHTSSC
eukprot:TRINITY_DN1071_c0_g1_i7.p1 TRINITY_DN1071_c0_g1~~TRINITY_DN1071_c0_g1_i7.p1  ORF type:complete len:560 (+),score=105.48 TRINITY_DN1071_c0_g1_i7:86-1765(+)